MPSIIDENKVLELLELSVPQKGIYVVMPIKDFVLNIISNASREVVLCKDCLEFKYCMHNEYNDPNGFCAWGRKKDAKEE